MYDVRHSIPFEFGTGEADDTIDTKIKNEGFYKLLSILKVMLDCLLGQINYDKRSHSLRTFGFLNSGLACTLVGLDRSTACIPRVKRHRTMEISADISQLA
ncbi:unnamed protein product [Rhizopus stolonifer]